jgi:hypothetical protein
MKINTYEIFSILLSLSLSSAYFQIFSPSVCSLAPSILKQTGKTVKKYVIPDTGSYATYSTAPCSTALVEKLTVTHLIKKFPAFYGT